MLDECVELFDVWLMVPCEYWVCGDVSYCFANVVVYV